MVESSQDVRNKFVSKGKAEFSMGILDYERYDANLKAIDNYSIASLQSADYMTPWYGAIRQFWRQLRAVLLSIDSNDIVVEYDDKFETIQLKIAGYMLTYNTIKARNPNQEIDFLNDENYMGIIKELGKLNEDMMFLKQNVGLGIVLRKDESFEKRLKRGLGLIK